MADLDPQATVSVCLAGEEVLGEMIAKGRTLEAYLALKLIQGEKTILTPRIRPNVSPTRHRNEPLALSLLPAGPYLEILKAIAAHPHAFPDIGAEVAKTGRALVVKPLKAKTLSLLGLRMVRGSLGAETFSLVVDGLTGTASKSLVSRLDKNHPDLKTAGTDWPRRHLVALAAGTEPVGKPSANGATPKPAAPEIPRSIRALGSAAFAVTWDSKDHEPKPKKCKSG